jgi:hypothetical protein
LLAELDDARSQLQQQQRDNGPPSSPLAMFTPVGDDGDAVRRLANPVDSYQDQSASQRLTPRMSAISSSRVNASNDRMEISLTTAIPDNQDETAPRCLEGFEVKPRAIDECFTLYANPPLSQWRNGRTEQAHQISSAICLPFTRPHHTDKAECMLLAI